MTPADSYVDALVYGVAIAMPIVLGLGLWGLVNLRKRSQGPHTLLFLISGNIMVLAFLLAIVFACGETYCRFIYDFPDSFGISKTSALWFTRYNNINTAGVRDSIEYMNQIADHKRRISFIGDSFTAGHGIRDVNKRFANLIRKQKQSEWEVHVLATNGLDTGKELQQIKDLIATAYQFDTVVFVYCINDIADIVPEWQNILNRIYADKNFDRFFIKHSYLINMMYCRQKARRDPDIADYFGFVKRAYASRLWDTQKKRLRELVSECRTNRVRLLVVTFPFLHALGADSEYQTIYNMLNEFWQEQGVPHLDLLPLFSKYDSRELQVSRYDAHPNELAHALAAEEILPFIKKNINP